MENTLSTFKITSDTFEVTGSSDFVIQQVDKFSDYFLAFRNQQINKAHAVLVHVENSQADSEVTNQNSITDNSDPNLYPQVYDLQSEVKIILKNAPGSTKSEQTKNIALLYLYGKKLKGLEDPTQYSSIKEVCKQYACLDESNFSTYLVKEKSLFIIEGKTAKTVRLTKPGEIEAENLAKQCSN